jgi:hypothetical protein
MRDVEGFESEVDAHKPQEILVALKHVRGRPNAVCHGKLEDGKPKPGVQVRRLEGHVHFDLTMTHGDSYTRETYSIPDQYFAAFACALLGRLRQPS